MIRDWTGQAPAVTPRVQTIGYREPDAEQRIAAFMAGEKTALVDIRLVARSPWNPLFNKKALAEQFSLRYGHCPELGNVNYKPADRPKGIVLKGPEEGLRKIMTLLQKGWSIMLLCACEDYESCHRKVVYELIKREQANALPRFFAFLAANLEALREDAGFDLTTIQEIEFEPDADAGDWWATTPDQFAEMWLYGGKPSVSYSGHRGDWL